MNKQELIDEIALILDLEKKKTKAVVEVFLELIEKELAAGGEVKLSKFGSFSVKQHQEREGRNPSTGEKLIIPAQKRVKFTPYKQLKEAV